MSASKDRHSEAETERRREAAIKQMLATPHKPHSPSNYVVLDGAIYPASIHEITEGSMLADLYRNDADFRAGRVMERSAALDLV